MSVAQTANRIIEETRAHHGVKKPEAVRIVARDIGVKPGALQRLLGGRLIHIERIEGLVKQYAVRRIERRIAALEHDLHIARMAAYRPDEPDLFRAQKALDEARKAIGKC